MNEKNKLKIVLCIIIIALLLTLVFFPLYRKINHCFDQEKEIHTITFHMSQEVPKGSYGHEMRIINAFVNGKSVDLTLFENENWVWHGEWGYVLYQNGEKDFCIESDEPIESFSMEYVKQEGSGVCRIELGDDVIDLSMYRRSWKNSVLTVSYQNTFQKYFSFADIFLLTMIIVFLGYRILVYLTKKDQIVGGIGSSLTMFDFAKGLGMIVIILGHSAEDVVVINDFLPKVNSACFGIIAIGIIYSLMAMFFIASGYGFKKGDIGTGTRKQLKFLLSPYWKVALGVTVVSLFRVWLDVTFNVKDLLFKVLPFALFSAHDGTVMGIDIGSIGPIWYGTSLCFGWIILSIIFQKDSKAIHFIGVAICAVIGFILSRFDMHLFCLTQTFASIPMIYAGYLIRNNKVWTKETGLKRIVYIVLAVLFFVGALVNGTPFSMAVNNWGNNLILAVVVSILGGFLLMRIMLSFNKLLKGKAKSIKKIGRESYYIFYIHTFEYLAVPWKQIMQGIEIAYEIKILFIFICRSILIWLLFIAIKRMRSMKRNANR